MMSFWCLQEHISLFVLIAEVEQAHVSWVHIEKTIKQQDRYQQDIKRYFIVF